MIDINNIDKNIFREYDIRGKYPNQINEDIAYLIGRSYGSYIKEKLNKNKCVVGHDNRYSSLSLSNNLIKGIIDSGCDVVDCGLVTTPMYYYACIKTNIIIGIMITASHNPKDDNGFKFSFDNLGNARGKMVYDFRDYTLEQKFLTGKGTIESLNILNDYKNAIFNGIKMGNRKLKVVIDCANGTTSLFAKEINSMFDNLDITMLFDESDSNFPNHHPDPVVKENMKFVIEKVLELNADLGIGYDGDGDRIGVVDNKGNIIEADKLMIIIIRSLINNVDNKTFLYDVKCSKSLEDTIIELGGNPLCYRTGNSYTRAKVNEDNLNFGGELSGHLYFNDKVWPCIDSGIYNGLKVMEILSNSNQSLYELTEDIPKYFNTPELKIAVSDNIKFKIVNEVIDYCKQKEYNILTIDGVRITFEDGWALVRASNTGPNLTIRFEATTEKRLTEIQNEFTNLINELLKNND